MMVRELFLSYPYFVKRKELNQTERWPAAKLQNLQGARLLKVLKLAVKKAPFYRDTVGNSVLSSDADPFQEVLRFPVIQKETVRKELERMVCGNPLRRLRVTTGGSTGQPLVFYMDRFVTRQVEKAFIFDQWRRVGYRVGDPIFNIRGRTPAGGRMVHHDKLFNIYFASSFDLNSGSIARYIEAMNRIQPKYLHGYPSTMYQLAILVENSGRSVALPLKAVFCGSEKLFPYQRTKIESVFHCSVYAWYGHSECLALGGGCEHCDRLHFYPQYGYTELLPTGQKTPDGQDIKEIVATGFNNPVMPLIRYCTGDYAVISEDRYCSCGRNYLMIDEIIGRQQEFVVDAKGQLISATSLIFGQHYEDFQNLSGLKLQQDRAGVLKVLAVPHSKYVAMPVEGMKRKMTELIGDRMKIEFEVVEHLEKSSIGKAKIVDQKLSIEDYLK
jgi:phenylacetate-CoA ligase